MVYIDENGDAAGNYTILSRKIITNSSKNEYGLFPIGTFTTPEGHLLPVSASQIVSITHFKYSNDDG